MCNLQNNEFTINRCPYTVLLPFLNNHFLTVFKHAHADNLYPRLIMLVYYVMYDMSNHEISLQ